MRINKITLCNLGSYEGTNTISICKNKRKNIVLIGGKNGAGKTTLFESIRLCLYGYKAFGYQLMSSAYKKHILSIINDTIKSNSMAYAYVILDIEIQDGQNSDSYVLKRSWNPHSEPFETFEVFKNSYLLDSDAIEDFTSYLMNLLPPSLFNLYFFDGEQIAEYFLSDEGGENLRSAFLTLCGYDTFEVILDNFNRIVKTKKTNNSVAEYVKGKEIFERLSRKENELNIEYNNITKEVHDIDARINKVENEYSKKGGITEEAWNFKLRSIKEQESLRDNLNQEIKKLTNEVIPLIILKDKICELKNQIDNEDGFSLDKATLVQLNRLLPSIVQQSMKKTGMTFSDKQLKSFIDHLNKGFEETGTNKDATQILKLSLSDRDDLIHQIKTAITIDKEVVLENRRNLKQSIEISKCLREEISHCSIDYIRNYQEEKKKLENLKLGYISKQLTLKSEMDALSIPLETAKIEYTKAEKNLEAELKRNSVIDLSSKSVLFLKNLLETLVKVKTKQLEDSFMLKINQLKQKDVFISKIKVDENFFIHAFKKIELSDGTVREQEIDKTRLSKGEKQVFIMSLYWALMTLSRTELPFMIDTPFARIDSEHREKITLHFFKDLPGQVFIFSTDEEVCGKNLELLKNRIGTSLLLENKVNKCTTIINDSYFEV